MDATLVTGDGVGSQFVASARSALTDAVGFEPYPGTLNLEGDGLDVDVFTGGTIEGIGDDHCDGVRLGHCHVGGIRAAVIKPLVPGYPAEKNEVLAPIHLREFFDLDPGDTVPVGPIEERWPPATVTAVGSRLDAFDGIVFDLDGTLVDLDVDWVDVRGQLETAIGHALDEPIESYDTASLYAAARERSVYDELESILENHEVRGAETATDRDLLSTLETLDRPVGICTANAEVAAEKSLERYGVAEAVDVIVGRDTLAADKPKPEPLLACLSALGVNPGNAVFLGDVESDCQTAIRAGTSFLAPSQITGP